MRESLTTLYIWRLATWNRTYCAGGRETLAP